MALAVLGAVAVSACGSESPSPTPSLSASAVPSVEPTPDLSAYVGLWENATDEKIGTTAEYTNRVEVADVSGDGMPDFLFANGGDYDHPSADGPVASRVFLNQGPGGAFLESPSLLAGLTGYTRVIKVRDLNRDGGPDIILGNTWQTQTQLLLKTGQMSFANATASLPQMPLSIGDLEVGDVDADGDLDLALVDWGAGSPFESGGGLVHLWLNDLQASSTDVQVRFTDVTAAQMPDTRIGFSWDIELMDVDNDWDLDLAISAKVATTSYLFTNDGAGHFTDVTADALPHFGNNYEFEPMDLDGDGFLDLVTVNDGDNPTGAGGREHVFANNGDGTFRDATDAWWPDADNPGEDDNAEIFLDVDSDRDSDFLLFSLSGSDRLMVNDGSGRLTMVTQAVNAPASRGSLGLAVADLNDDGRLDVVESQGEVPGSFDERLYLATDAMAPDTAEPRVWTNLSADASGTVTVNARVTDGLSPYVPGHPANVWVTWDQVFDQFFALDWYGEYLFRATIDIPDGATGLQVCATDGYDNQTCVPAN